MKGTAKRKVRAASIKVWPSTFPNFHVIVFRIVKVADQTTGQMFAAVSSKDGHF